MGFLDGLLDAVTFGGYSAVGDLLGTPKQIWDENRSVNNSKELVEYQTGKTKELQQHQADLGKDVFDYTFGKEASLNQHLMETSPSVQKQAMIDAGINPASNFGTFGGNLAQSSAPAFSASAGSASAPIASKPSISDIANLGLSLANAGLVNEQKRKLKLENDATEEENNFYAKFDEFYDWDVENGKVVAKPIDNNMVVPEVLRTNAKTRKGVEARHLSFGRLMAEKSELDKVVSQNELAKKVADGKIKDNKVIKAMIHMDEQDYNRLVQDIKNLKQDEEIKKLQVKYDQKRNAYELPEQKLQILEHKIKESTNIRLILDKFTDGSWSIGDLIYILCAVSFK